MANTFQLDIVSAETELYSGKAQKLFATGSQGELEILPMHAPLLTALSPGPVWIITDTGEERSLVVLGGMLEVQPNVTTLLADAALRGEEIDEAQALKVKERAEKAIAEQVNGLDYEKTHTELSVALAQLRIIKKLKGSK